jgi:acyl-coenzyme A thioesterase PaaI-like protein
MNLASILDQIRPDHSVHTLSIPTTWHQGRTAYGGLSSALAFQAARVVSDDMPPLQSAQIAFVGPLSGEVSISASLMRRGKNTAFVKSEVSGEGGVGLTGTFVFMNPRSSQLDFAALPVPDFPPIPDAAHVRTGPAEFFTGQMQYPDKRIDLTKASNRLASWHRFTERDGLDPAVELLCIGDALPPSAMGLMSEKVIVSSMNWQINMLTQTPSTKDGWWYLESETQHAANGSSSQTMSVWNSDGQAMMTGMQSVAIFG